LPKLIESRVRQPIDEHDVSAGRVADLRASAILRHFVKIEPGSRTAVLLDMLRLIGRADLGPWCIFERHDNAAQSLAAYGM